MTPTGNYWDDCETGKIYAVEFLKSCDGTVGWSSLLTQIVADMIRAGPDGSWSDGGVRLNGVVVGFMSTIGKRCACWRRTDAVALRALLGAKVPKAYLDDLRSE